MPSYPNSNGYHQAFEPYGSKDIGAEEERAPQKGENIDLDLTGYNSIFAESLDVCA